MEAGPSSFAQLVLFQRPASTYAFAVQLDSPTLEGQFVRLSPVDRSSLAELSAAALSAPEMWEHIPYRMQTPSDVAAFVDRFVAMRAAHSGIAFATRLRSTGQVVGGTTIVAIDRGLPSVEIGFTWLVPDYQRTAVNTEAKLLQLRHCFDVLGCERVELKTDIRNLRSRAAIARLGASQEGILRAHRRRLDGSLRDSVLFSIIASEWPAVRDRLETRLSK